MGELINLRRARKSKLRDEKEAQASQNRALFGRPASEKKQQAQHIERSAKLLDGHLLAPRDKEPQ
jgi:Domain of unknown function (DUF4169)